MIESILILGIIVTFAAAIFMTCVGGVGRRRRELPQQDRWAYRLGRYVGGCYRRGGTG